MPHTKQRSWWSPHTQTAQETGGRTGGGGDLRGNDKKEQRHTRRIGKIARRKKKQR